MKWIYIFVVSDCGVGVGLLQCGSRCALWTVSRPTGSTPCPNSLRWTSWGCESWSSSTLSLKDKGSSTEANRFGGKCMHIDKSSYMLSFSVAQKCIQAWWKTCGIYLCSRLTIMTIGSVSPNPKFISWFIAIYKHVLL